MNVNVKKEERQPTVIHVVISLDHGGLERLVAQWTLRRNRLYPGSTSVCCLDAGGTLAAELPAETVMAIGARRNRFPWDRDAVRRLRAMAKERGASVLHSHNLAAQQYAVLAAWGTNLRVVHTEHGSRPQAGGLVGRLRELFLNRMTDRLVAVSRGEAARFAGKAAVIPNGISPHVPPQEDERSSLRRELGLPGGRRVVGYVGRLATVKGVDRLIWALGQLAAKGCPGIVVLLVGDGPERASLELHARKIGVAPAVVFAGFREDARRLYDLMDCFVLPSRSEGLSVALLEAMAAGVPALATDVGSNREVLLNGDAGVVLPEDCGQWADIFRRVVEQPEPFRRLAEKGREHVLMNYSEDATAELYEKIYGEVVLGAWCVVLGA